MWWAGAVLAALLLPAVGCDRAGTRGDDGAAGASATGAAVASPRVPAARDLPTPEPAATADALAALLADSAPPAPLDPATWARVRTLYGVGAAAAAPTVPRPRWLDAARRDRAARALATALDSAPTHALQVPPVARAAVAAAAEGLGDVTSAVARARADALLTGAFVAYGRAMLVGQVAPRAVATAWYIDPRAVDVDSALARAFAADDAAAGLAALAPQDDGYDGLRAALARYRAIVARGGWEALGAGRTVRPDDRLDARLADRLMRRLAAEGFLAASDAGALGGALGGALARFQAAHGLAADSVLGPATRRALDVPADRRLAQIAANLERYRWLPPELGARHIRVNIPAFRLDAFDGGRRVLSMRVVVGDEVGERQTPILADTMTYVQFGPYWNVPVGIARREILPNARRDRGWLARHGYEVVRGWGDDAPVVDPRRLSTAALFSDRYRVRQRPGPDNALGRVKFMFPNAHAIYLHDTPARALFDARVRAASHGCVRVGDPAALAAFVLAAQDGWTPARIRAALAAGRRERVDLARPVPVYLLYLTAAARGDTVVFRPDRYERDQALVDALGPVPDGSGARAALRALDARLSPTT